jgi:hypothetical protein
VDAFNPFAGLDPDNPEHRAQVQAFLDRLELGIHQDRLARASGWIVLTIDDEYDEIVHAVGPFPDQYQAMIEAELALRDDEKIKEDGEVGWTHRVVPMFPPDAR